MRRTHAIWALGVAAVTGTAAGQVVPRLWAAQEAGVRAARAEEDRASAEARAREAQRQWTQLARELDGEQSARALQEADALGILAEVARERPQLRPDAQRRVGVALVSEARRHGLDPLLLAAVARVESRFDPYATSQMGAVGLLQIRPPTGKAMIAEDGGRLSHDAQLYEIETNVALGARYLAGLARRYPSLDQALLAYNRGPVGAGRALRGPDASAALAGYPHAVLAERERLALRARRRDQGG